MCKWTRCARRCCFLQQLETKVQDCSYHFVTQQKHISVATKLGRCRGLFGCRGIDFIRISFVAQLNQLKCHGHVLQCHVARFGSIFSGSNHGIVDDKLPYRLQGLEGGSLEGKFVAFARVAQKTVQSCGRLATFRHAARFRHFSRQTRDFLECFFFHGGVRSWVCN